MRPTTRRVTAQRKFAQGAFVLPVVSAAPAAAATTVPTTITTAERREAPTNSQDARNTIFDNNMSASNLLDVVCFANAHSHTQPIVLVERLRGQDLLENSDTDSIPPPPEPPAANVAATPVAVNRKRVTGVRGRPVLCKAPKPRDIKPNSHGMCLRSRQQRRPPQRLMSSPFKWPLRRKTKSLETTHPKAKEVPRKTCVRLPSTSNYSVDDNKPLTYFVTSNPKPNGPAPENPRTSMGPPTMIPELHPTIVIDDTEYGSTSSVINLIMPSPSPSPVPSDITVAGSSDITNPFSNSQVIKPHTVSDCSYRDLEPGSCGLYRFKGSTVGKAKVETNANGGTGGFYDSNFVGNWIQQNRFEEQSSASLASDDDESFKILYDEKVNPILMQTHPKPCLAPECSLCDLNKVARTISTQQVIRCPSAGWKTVKTAASVPKRVFDSRCEICLQCKMIEKVIVLSELLKKCDTLQTEELAQTSEKHDYLTDYYYIDLLPRHPHKMIKLMVRKTPHRIYGACLIPRSDAKPSTEFVLANNIHIIDRAVETVSSDLLVEVHSVNSSNVNPSDVNNSDVDREGSPIPRSGRRRSRRNIDYQRPGPSPCASYTDNQQPGPSTSRAMDIDEQQPGPSTSRAMDIYDQQPGPSTSRAMDIYDQQPGPSTSRAMDIYDQQPGPSTSRAMDIYDQQPGPSTSRAMYIYNQQPGPSTSRAMDIYDQQPGPSTSRAMDIYDQQPGPSTSRAMDVYDQQPGPSTGRAMDIDEQQPEPSISLVMDIDEQHPLPSRTWIINMNEQQPVPSTSSVSDVDEQQLGPTTDWVIDIDEQQPEPSTNWVIDIDEQQPEPSTSSVIDIDDQEPEPSTSRVMDIYDQQPRPSTSRAMDIYDQQPRPSTSRASDTDLEPKTRPARRRSRRNTDHQRPRRSTSRASDADLDPKPRPARRRSRRNTDYLRPRRSKSRVSDADYQPPGPSTTRASDADLNQRPARRRSRRNTDYQRQRRSTSRASDADYQPPGPSTSRASDADLNQRPARRRSRRNTDYLRQRRSTSRASDADYQLPGPSISRASDADLYQRPARKRSRRNTDYQRPASTCASYTDNQQPGPSTRRARNTDKQRPKRTTKGAMNKCNKQPRPSTSRAKDIHDQQPGPSTSRAKDIHDQRPGPSTSRARDIDKQQPKRTTKRAVKRCKKQPGPSTRRAMDIYDQQPGLSTSRVSDTDLDPIPKPALRRSRRNTDYQRPRPSTRRARDTDKQRPKRTTKRAMDKYNEQPRPSTSRAMDIYDQQPGPSTSRVSDTDLDPIPRPARRRTRRNTGYQRPRRSTSRAMDIDNQQPGPSTSRASDADDLQPGPSTSRARDADDQQPGPSTSRARDADDQQPGPSTSRASDPDDQQPGPSTCRASDAEDQQPRPSTCRASDADDQQPGPSTGRARSRASNFIADAPTFYPNTLEFEDTLSYLLKIWDSGSNCGICKIVPPTSFDPKCHIDDNLRFNVTNQYISRLFQRWNKASSDLCLIKACLKRQKIDYQRAPLLMGMETNLPKLLRKVKAHGGLETVINKKRWTKVAMDLQYPVNPFIERKLDLIYVKFILPFDTLTNTERQELKARLQAAWEKKRAKLIERANNPLHRQKQLLGESDSSSDETDGDDDDDDGYDAEEVEECIKPGSSMNLSKFKKISKIVFNSIFRSQVPDCEQIEEEYWKLVTQAEDHLCVHGASIDTGSEGYGFTKSRSDPHYSHPWNLKMFAAHRDNVLRPLGPTVGVTVPTLHLGMVFTTSCWQRDPHDLACIDYNHTGSPKIWYGIPEKEEENFREAAETLCPTLCQKKSHWLSSDIAMIPPKLLVEQNVELYRVEQKPGEFVLVMPRAYSCSINTGYTVSESTYFANSAWVDTLGDVFKEIRESCEPTMFSLEQLLKAVAEDPVANVKMLLRIQPLLESAYHREIENRAVLESRLPRVAQKSGRGKRTSERPAPSQPTPSQPTPSQPTPSQPTPSQPTPSQPTPNQPTPSQPRPAWNVRDMDECEICRCPLYLSKVKHLPTKNSVLCLEHAIKLLDHTKYADIDISTLELIYNVPTADLKKTIDNLQGRIVSDDRQTSEEEDCVHSVIDWTVDFDDEDFCEDDYYD